MDSFDIGTFKLEKARSSQRSRLKKVANFMRAIELCIVLVVISSLSGQIPFAVKNFGEYFKGLKIVLLSPVFVFLLGNVIVITLFTKSRKIFDSDLDSAMKIDRLYEECVEKTQRIHNQEVVAEKRMKAFKRVRSEIFSYKNDRKLTRVLHRTKTERQCMRSSDSADKSENTSVAEVDAMSNEEFCRKIEDFIAKQQKFRMEEEQCATQYFTRN